MGPGMTDKRIADAVAELWGLAARAEETGSRMGFFAALYARVTSAIAACIDRRFFDDGSRMERLDVRFASLYLDAAARRLAGTGGVSRAWTVAFDACEERDPIVLQHLYLGMNAHLMVDLPIAVADIGGPLASLQRDFRKINQVVDAEMGAFHADLCGISPRLARWHERSAWLWAAGSQATLFVARERAFYRAGRLMKADASGRERLVDDFDREAARLGKEILRPRVGAGIVRRIRTEECDDVRHIIRALRGARGAPAAARSVLEGGQRA